MKDDLVKINKHEKRICFIEKRIDKIVEFICLLKKFPIIREFIGEKDLLDDTCTENKKSNNYTLKQKLLDLNEIVYMVENGLVPEQHSKYIVDTAISISLSITNDLNHVIAIDSSGKFSSAKHSLSVGEQYGGGTVFCVGDSPDVSKYSIYGSGSCGLIMANEDQVNFDSNRKHGVTWSSEYKETGALSYDDGAANTAAIIAVHPKDNPDNNAAWLCHSYRGGDYEDWYLPSKNELNKMYLFAKANNLIGKNLDDDNVCWSSTEHSDRNTRACIQHFIDGHQGDFNKDHFLGVRAVRAFSFDKCKRYWSSTEYHGSYGDAWNQHFSSGSQRNYNKIYGYFGARAVRAFSLLK
jgi:hypothetical protein